MKILEELQNTMCRALLQVPLSTPKPSLRAAFGLESMKCRVMQAKVLLVMAIRRQEMGGLAREVLEEQLCMGFPGLGQEVREICKEVGLPYANRMDVQVEQVKDAFRIKV